MTMAGLRAHCVICQGLLPPQPNSSNKDSSGDAAAELSYLRQAILHPPAVHVELPSPEDAEKLVQIALAILAPPVALRGPIGALVMDDNQLWPLPSQR